MLKKDFYILEAPGDVTGSLFYKMKEYEIPNVYLKPEKDQIADYVIGADNPIVILNLIFLVLTLITSASHIMHFLGHVIGNIIFNYILFTTIAPFILRVAGG